MPPMKKTSKNPAKKAPVEFHATQRLEHGYAKGIKAIIGRVLVKQKPEQTFSQWLNELALRSRMPDILAASELLATRMVHGAQKSNWRSWREAASRSSQAGKLYQLLETEMRGPTGARVQQLIRENASLISSLPLEAATTLTNEVTKAQQAGARPATIAKMYQKRFPELLRSRTRLISRTEAQKASSALTRARSEALNLEWFEWATSHDQRTRASHENLNGVLCSWGDLPDPEALVDEKPLGKYAPGNIFNCRCLIIPLLAFSDVSWPHRVYRNGSIKTMTLTQFKQVASGDIAEAA